MRGNGLGIDQFVVSESRLHAIKNKKCWLNILLAQSVGKKLRFTDGIWLWSRNKDVLSKGVVENFLNCASALTKARVEALKGLKKFNRVFECLGADDFRDESHYRLRDGAYYFHASVSRCNKNAVQGVFYESR